MYYIVFSRDQAPDGGLTSTVHHRSNAKYENMNSFKAQIEKYFTVTSPPGDLYCTGFSAALPFIEEISKENASITDKEIVDTVLRNLELANYCINLNSAGYQPKLVLSYACEICGQEETSVQKNAYGEYLCQDCWANYLVSERGLVEYYIGIASGTYRKSSFSGTLDLDAIEDAWEKHKTELGRTAFEIEAIEDIYESVPTLEPDETTGET